MSAIPVLFGISVILFALIQFTPGGPVEQLMAQWRQSGIGETGGGRITAITEEQRQRLVAYYGFDKPLTVRYFSWLGKTLRGDLGESYHSDEPVLTLLKRHLPVSIALGLLSFLLTYAVCLPLGIAKAMRPHTLFDRLTTAFIIFLYSIPPFTLGILLLVFLGGGSFLDLFPLAGVTSDRFGELSFFDKIFDLAHHLTLPVLCYTAGGFASLTLLMKSSLLDQLQQDPHRNALRPPRDRSPELRGRSPPRLPGDPSHHPPAECAPHRR
ncbi:MAG: ABC transporter permease subunit [Deltaproteobacteria bacterium]|nr:ABC transporter permease subunit [Deltaproteobacteria bacterium]